MEPNPYLTLSSILFIIPTTMSAYNRQWNLYATFLFLTIVSSLYHATKYQPLLYLDYPGCYLVVLVTGYENWKNGRTIFWMKSCSLCCILFWGGWIFNSLIFSKDNIEKNVSHVGMHVIFIVSGSLTSHLNRKQNGILNYINMN